MSVAFSDFLESAEVLLNNQDSKEIDFRNLISRSYYALFLLSREKSETFPIPTDKYKYEKYMKSGVHEKIIIKFEENADIYIKRLGYILRQRKIARCRADYDIHENIVRSESAKHFSDVKGAIKRLEQLKENP
jgi:hypothetical protein